jgi:hypothetical protein
MRRSHDHRDLRSLGATWRAPYFDLASGLYVPPVVSWDPATGEFTPVEGTEGWCRTCRAPGADGRVSYSRARA